MDSERVSRGKRRQSELLTDISNLEPNLSKRSSFSRAAGKLKEFNTPKAPRSRHVSAPPPDSTVEIDYSRSSVSPCPTTSQSPSPSPSPSSLCTVIKEQRHVLTEAMNVLQAHIEHNATLAIQKSMALQVFGAAVRSGMHIVDACKLSSLATGFNHKVIHRWAQNIFVDFFASKSSLEDVTEQQLDHELESERGKHPKWISLTSDENFEMRLRMVTDDGLQKGMKTVLQERGVDTTGINASKMKELLLQYQARL